MTTTKTNPFIPNFILQQQDYPICLNQKQNILLNSIQLEFLITGNMSSVTTFTLQKDGTSIATFTPKKTPLTITYTDTDVLQATTYTYTLTQNYSNGNSQLLKTISQTYNEPVINLSLSQTYSNKKVVLTPDYTLPLTTPTVSFDVYKKLSTVTTYTFLGSVDDSYIDTDIQTGLSYDYKYTYGSQSQTQIITIPSFSTLDLGQQSNVKYSVKLQQLDNSATFNPKTFTITQSKGINTTYQQTIDINRYKDSSLIFNLAEGTPYYYTLYKNGTLVDSQVIFLRSKSYDTKYKSSLSLTFVGQEYVFQNTFNYSFPTKLDMQWLADKRKNYKDYSIIEQYLDQNSKTGVYDGLSINSILMLLSKYISENFSIIKNTTISFNNGNFVNNPTAIPEGFPYTTLNGSQVGYQLQFDYLTPLYNVLTTLSETYNFYPVLSLQPIDVNDFSKGLSLEIDNFIYDDSSSNYPEQISIDINGNIITNIRKQVKANSVRNKQVVFGKQFQTGQGVMQIANTRDISGLENTPQYNLDYTIPIGVKSEYILTNNQAMQLQKKLLNQYAYPNTVYTISLNGYIPKIVAGLTKLTLTYSGDNTVLQTEYGSGKTVYISSLQTTIKPNEITATITANSQKPIIPIAIKNLGDSTVDSEQVVIYNQDLVNSVTGKTIAHFNNNSDIFGDYSIDSVVGDTIYDLSGVTITPSQNLIDYISYIDFIQPTTEFSISGTMLNSDYLYLTPSTDQNIVQSYIQNCYIELSNSGTTYYSGYITKKLITSYTDNSGVVQTLTNPIQVFTFDEEHNIDTSLTYDIKIKYADDKINVRTYYTVGSHGDYYIELLSEINDNGSITVNNSNTIEDKISLVRIISDFNNPDNSDLYQFDFTPLNSDNKIDLQSNYDYSHTIQNGISYNLYIAIGKYSSSAKNINTEKKITFSFNKKIYIENFKYYYETFKGQVQDYSITVKKGSNQQTLSNTAYLYYTRPMTLTINNLENLIGFFEDKNKTPDITLTADMLATDGHYPTTGKITVNNIYGQPIIVKSVFIGNRKYSYLPNPLLPFYDDLSSVSGEQLVENPSVEVSSKVELTLSHYQSVLWANGSILGGNSELGIGAILQSPYSYDKDISIQIWVNNYTH